MLNANSPKLKWIKEVLGQQLHLLSERSKDPNITPDELCHLTRQMIDLVAFAS